MRRVPSLPLTARIRRPLARLPLGGPTGIACAAAGAACVVGIVLANPALPFPEVHDEHRPIAGTDASASVQDPRGQSSEASSASHGRPSGALARTVSTGTGSVSGGSDAGDGTSPTDGVSAPVTTAVPAGVSDPGASPGPGDAQAGTRSKRGASHGPSGLAKGWANRGQEHRGSDPGVAKTRPGGGAGEDDAAGRPGAGSDGSGGS